MDKKLKADMRKHFREEYFQAALDKRPGWGGKVARWSTRPLSRRSKAGVGLLATAEIAGIGVAAVTGGIVPALIVLGAINVAGLPVNAPAGISLLKAQRAAGKTLDRDIGNGTLTARYKAEVLDKQSANAAEATPARKRRFGLRH